MVLVFWPCRWDPLVEEVSVCMSGIGVVGAAKEHGDAEGDSSFVVSCYRKQTGESLGG